MEAPVIMTKMEEPNRKELHEIATNLILITFVFNVFHVSFSQGSVANKFYVHNDIFCYEDEVFGDSEAELDEGETPPTYLLKTLK